MAIKQRVLAKVKSAYEALQRCDSSDMAGDCQGALGYLQQAERISCIGISGVYDSQYKPLYSGLINALERVASGMDDGGERQEILTLSKELLELLVGQIEKEVNFKKEIVFLPYKASMWDSMESVWQAAVDDNEHAIAYVVPIPYFDRDENGNVREWHCETAEFPEYVPVIDFQRIDLEAMHPDVIVIQNPYDGYNTVTSVDVKYYSKNLKKYTNKLVYIPYYVLEEVDPDDEAALEDIAHFIFHGEAVINSNITIVQSEDMKEAYIRLLEKYTNKKRDYWEKHILGIGSPKIDKLFLTEREKIKLPEDWIRIMKKTDGNMKKAILYNVSLSSLKEHKDKLLDKMEWVFQVFREKNNEIALIWRPHPLIEAMLASQVPEIWERYKCMVEQYQSEAWGIYDDSNDLHRAIAVSDGYYGDMSSLVEMYRRMKKPVLLQDVLSLRNHWIFFADVVSEDGCLYFYDMCRHVVLRLARSDGSMEAVLSLPKHYQQDNDYGLVYKHNHKYILLPCKAKKILEYDGENNAYSEPVIISNHYGKEKMMTFAYHVDCQDKCYFWGTSSSAIVVFDKKSENYHILDGWYEALIALCDSDFSSLNASNSVLSKEAIYDRLLVGSCVLQNHLFIVCMQANVVLEIDLLTEEYCLHRVGSVDNRFVDITFDGKYFYLLQLGLKPIIKWDYKTKETWELENFLSSLQLNEDIEDINLAYRLIRYENMHIVLYPGIAQDILCIDSKQGNLIGRRHRDGYWIFKKNNIDGSKENIEAYFMDDNPVNVSLRYENIITRESKVYSIDTCHVKEYQTYLGVPFEYQPIDLERFIRLVEENDEGKQQVSDNFIVGTRILKSIYA